MSKKGRKPATHTRREEEKGNKVIVVIGVVAVLLAIGIIAVAALVG